MLIGESLFASRWWGVGWRGWGIRGSKFLRYECNTQQYWALKNRELVFWELLFEEESKIFKIVKFLLTVGVCYLSLIGRIGFQYQAVAGGAILEFHTTCGF